MRIIKKWICFLKPINLLRSPDVIRQAQTIKDILGIALTDCFIDATTVEPCFPPCYALYP